MSAVLAHDGIDHLFIGMGAAAAVGIYGAAWLAQPRPVARSRRSEVDGPVRHGGRSSAFAGRNVNVWRLLSWIAGVCCVLVASLPWMEALAEESFTGHMVQHLLVIIVGAPLLVLAQPVHTLGRAGWLPIGSRLGPTGRRWAAAWRRYTPVIGPMFFVAVLFVTHLTSIYDQALDNRLVHELEHAAYLLGATLTWSAVLGIGRGGAVARIGGVFGVAAGGALLGMVLLSAPSPLIPTYEAQLGTQEALNDQRSASALMWVGGMLTTVPLLLLAVAMGRHGGASSAPRRGAARRRCAPRCAGPSQNHGDGYRAGQSPSGGHAMNEFIVGVDGSETAKRALPSGCRSRRQVRRHAARRHGRHEAGWVNRRRRLRYVARRPAVRRRATARHVEERVTSPEHLHRRADGRSSDVAV